MEFPKRKPNRLPHYDYSSNGAYFVTICTENRLKTLGDIVGEGTPVLTTQGRISERLILEMPKKYPYVSVDKYVVMPNHIHLLLRMDKGIRTGTPSPTLGDMIGWYKYQVTKEVNLKAGTLGKRFFQRSYHDHIVRGDRSYLKIWEYIDTNPLKWAEDCFYTE